MFCRESHLHLNQSVPMKHIQDPFNQTEQGHAHDQCIIRAARELDRLDTLRAMLRRWLSD